MGISKQNFHVVPHAQICVSKMKRDRRDNIQRFIIIFIISNFLKFMIEMLLDNVKVDNYKVSVKLNSYLVSRIKKIIQIVTDGTKIQLTFDLHCISVSEYFNGQKLLSGCHKLPIFFFFGGGGVNET